MKIDYHNGFTGVGVVEATRVVIRDQYDQPVILIFEHGGLIMNIKAGDPKFNEYLAAMGIGPGPKAEVMPLRAGEVVL